VRAFHAGEPGACVVVKLLLGVPAVAVALVSVANPALAERLGLDVWNLPGLHAKIDEAADTDRAYSADSEDVQHRIAVKETIIDDVLAERCDLAAATARFAELNATRPQCMAVIRATYAGDTDDEKLARNVISFCAARAPAAQRAALAERLEAQLNRMRSSH
jgi:hypothetical protein